MIAKQKIIPLVIVVAAVVAVLVLVKILPKKQENNKTVPSAPISVRVEVIEPSPIVEDAFWIPGIVEPNRIVEVAAEVDARVEAYAGRKDRLGPDKQLIPGPASAGTVDEGEVIRKAQPILYLNTDLLSLWRDQIKAEYDFQQQELVRINLAYRREIATQLEVDTTLKQYNVAKATLELAQANLQRAVILAPIEGVLNRLPVEVGEYVTPGVVVAEIVEMDTVKVVLDVPERDIGYLKLGQEIKIVYGLDAPENATGRITYISELADESARTTRVELSIKNRLSRPEEPLALDDQPVALLQAAAYPDVLTLEEGFVQVHLALLRLPVVVHVHDVSFLQRYHRP